MDNMAFWYSLIVLLAICKSSSSNQNSKLLERVISLEMKVFGDSLCQNCMLNQRVEYLERVLKSILAKDLVSQLVNWPNHFGFTLACAVTNFGFSIMVAVLRICYQFKTNKKFKKWEESEEIKFLHRLKRMQFPQTMTRQVCQKNGK